VDARSRNALVRWLLLASVTLGTVVMHHVLADAESAAAVHSSAAAPMAGLPVAGHPAPDPGHDHDVLHLCMAVIHHPGTALILLLFLAGLVAPVISRHLRIGLSSTRSPARPPPRPAGRALLHTVCVARL
jgi:hypothetical protein